MDLQYKLAKDLFNNSTIPVSIKVKLNFKTVIQSECLYEAQCLFLNEKSKLEKLEEKKKRCYVKIFAPSKMEMNEGK